MAIKTNISYFNNICCSPICSIKKGNKQMLEKRKIMGQQEKKVGKSEITSIRLSEETKASLVKFAIEDSRTFTSLVAKILVNWLKEQKKGDSWR
jgi:hypothetical protein